METRCCGADDEVDSQRRTGFPCVLFPLGIRTGAGRLSKHLSVPNFYEKYRHELLITLILASLNCIWLY